QPSTQVPREEGSFILTNAVPGRQGQDEPIDQGEDRRVIGRPLERTEAGGASSMGEENVRSYSSP
ncbi:unnamed protein product, partial [Amoebophrya sp. A25]